MIENKSIGVVVPAYNEGALIEKVISTMPDFVDHMIIINDASSDSTYDTILKYKKIDSRIIVINHEINQGVGQTLIDGYLKAREMKIDVTAVMAGDAQMDPDDLYSVVYPVVTNEADYVKGSRLLVDGVKKVMPTYRFIGNNVLTLLTKFATGYWHVIDPQCGYTAISLDAISTIPIQDMIKRYGYPGHILHMLNLNNFAVKDVKVRPVYGDEVSKIKLGNYIRTVSVLLIKLFWKRITKKYLLVDFNPLAMFYFLALLCLPASIFFGIRMLFVYFSVFIMPSTTLILFVFTALMGTQSLFFAMWMDMEDNRKLRR